MCDINKKSEKKTATVYKVVNKFAGKYYSYFAGTEIRIGKVKPQTDDDLRKFHEITELMYQKYGITGIIGNRYYKSNHWYNSHMVGRTSGFADVDSAKTFINCCRKSEPLCILKMEIGGTIWEGSGKSTLHLLMDSTVYAGDKVLSFEEI